MVSQRYYKIKRNDLVEGTKNCIFNISQLLEKAEHATEKDSDNSIALGLYSFAIEEFGKALLLKEYLSKNKKEYKVSKDLFTGRESHNLKFDKALENLPIECKYAVPGIRISSNTNSKPKKIVLTPRGDSVTIPPGSTGTVSMAGTFPTNFDMRMSCFYVDWDDKKQSWKYRPHILAESIKRGVWKFKQEIYKFERSFLNDS